MKLRRPAVASNSLVVLLLVRSAPWVFASCWGAAGPVLGSAGFRAKPSLNPRAWLAPSSTTCHRGQAPALTRSPLRPPSRPLRAAACAFALKGSGAAGPETRRRHGPPARSTRHNTCGASPQPFSEAQATSRLKLLNKHTHALRTIKHTAKPSRLSNHLQRQPQRGKNWGRVRGLASPQLFAEDETQKAPSGGQAPARPQADGLESFAAQVAGKMVLPEDLPLGLDAFCHRQFDDASYTGTRLNYDKQKFIDEVNAFLRDSPSTEFSAGYAPFCRHVFVPNFVNALAGHLEITKENRNLLRCGYASRRASELPVLTRWFRAKDVGAQLKPTKWLDLILYSREQIEKENKAMQTHQIQEAAIEKDPVQQKFKG
eukprot:GHVT01071708.1.p1 GENE.GHVT01071708.1~~GHVT01071708.1.p1  ORF type:complete len:372 (+),score=79.44 GHVT01071708.1:264-1379(+)